MPFVHRLSLTSLSFRSPYFIFTAPPRAHELFHSPSIFTEHAKHWGVIPVNKPQTPPDYSFLNLLSSHGSHIWFIPHSRWVALLRRNQTEANSSGLFFLTKSLCLRSPEGWESAHFPTNTEWLILVISVPPLWLRITKTCDVLTLWQNLQTFTPLRPLTWNDCMLFFLFFYLNTRTKDWFKPGGLLEEEKSTDSVLHHDNAVLMVMLG